jgi:Glutathione S-transferase, N-terminal domain
MLEELGLPYELKMLPFPPRVFAKDYLALNPLGTIPYLIDGETKMTESSGICHYLGTKYGPTSLVVGLDEPAYGAFLNWMYFSDATLTFPQTRVLRYSQLDPKSGATRRSPPTTPNGSLAAKGGRSGDGQRRDAVRGPLHRGRYRDRLRIAAGRQYRSGQKFRAECCGVLGPVAATRRFQAGGGRRAESRGGAKTWLRAFAIDLFRPCEERSDEAI